MVAIVPEPPTLLPELQAEKRKLEKRLEEVNVAIKALVDHVSNVPYGNRLAAEIQEQLNRVNAGNAIASGAYGPPQFGQLHTK